MEEKRSWWQWLRYIFLTILGLLVVVLAVRALLINGTGFDATMTKTVTQTATKSQTTLTTTTVYQSGKTLWDWLQLLIIPFVIAVAGYVINLTISRTEHETALDKQHEATLKEYIEKMSEFLFHENLLDSVEGDKVRRMANIWTALALTRLDETRRSEAIVFLKFSSLLEADNIIDLDLSGDSLEGTDFSDQRLVLHSSMRL